MDFFAISCVANSNLYKINAGYTCGLQQLLHIVTIGFAHANIDAGSTLSPMALAGTIRDYIEEYFACDECNKLFQQNYDLKQHVNSVHLGILFNFYLHLKHDLKWACKR